MDEDEQMKEAVELLTKCLTDVELYFIDANKLLIEVVAVEEYEQAAEMQTMIEKTIEYYAEVLFSFCQMYGLDETSQDEWNEKLNSRNADTHAKMMTKYLEWKNNNK